MDIVFLHTHSAKTQDAVQRRFELVRNIRDEESLALIRNFSRLFTLFELCCTFCDSLFEPLILHRKFFGHCVERRCKVGEFVTDPVFSLGHFAGDAECSSTKNVLPLTFLLSSAK